MGIFKELYAYRTMIASLVRKDLKGRYKGSVLGFLWTFINPLLQLAIYTFVFQIILHNQTKYYYIHLFVALVPWIFFSSSLTTGSKAILGQYNLVKKIYFPREVLPISYATSSLVNMLLSFIVIFVVLIFSAIFTDFTINVATWLLLPIIILIEYLLVVGVTLITSSLTVYLRDLEHIMGVLSMAWMYLSPVVYPISMIDRYKDLHPILYQIYMLNPVTPLVLSYRDILYYGQVPNGMYFVRALIESIIICVLGFVIFGKLKKQFAEEL